MTGKPTVAAPAMTEELASEFVADQNAEAAGMVPVGISVNRKFLATQRAKNRAKPQQSIVGDKEYKVLHPTKGWRRFTAKRAGVYEAMAKQREFWGTIFGPVEKSTARDPEPFVAKDLPPSTITRQRRRQALRTGVAIDG